MRPAILIAVAVSLLAGVARADDTGAPKASSARTAKPVRFDEVSVTGHRPAPVAIVLTRDQAAKRQLDQSIDEHVRDAAERGR